MVTAMLIVLFVIVYLFIGMLTWMLSCVYDRLEMGYNSLKDDIGWLLLCLFVWVIVLPIIVVLIVFGLVKDKANNAVETIVKAIEEIDK